MAKFLPIHQNVHSFRAFLCHSTNLEDQFQILVQKIIDVVIHVNILILIIVSRSDLTGAIPPELGNLENLVELDVARNFLTGSIPASIFNISTLQYIGVSRNNLSGTLPANI
ncbi:putative LRR receptor-like serine/threonine-protein kinase [Forsythia ovata]|uniref:LRR receptor-like serine/threonine-protein kinase n=1 Tax=Forsythia ovata TaxID=205694 RepID=A0ABD1SJZ4_9LAMI